MKGGYGITAHGRNNHGQHESRYEPRFLASVPTDGATDVSIYFEPIWFVLYSFSSWLDESGIVRIEISEDGGMTYADAYTGGAWIAPFNGTYSRMYRVDGQQMKIYVHKTASWAVDQEIRVRVTAVDEFGNVATKVPPVIWGIS